jgi:hypothetical protein
MEDPAVTAFEIAWKEKYGLSKAVSVPKLHAPKSSKIRLVFPATSAPIISESRENFK